MRSQQQGLGLVLPKLKRDVAVKLQPRDGNAQQQGNATTTGGKSTRPQQQQSTHAGHDENVDTASPVLDKAPAMPSRQPIATTRKGRRTKQQVRMSEQHTVYYDAMQSPDDASTYTQPKSRLALQAAAESPSLGHAAQAVAPAAVMDACKADLFDTQPEPMDADDISDPPSEQLPEDDASVRTGPIASTATTSHGNKQRGKQLLQQQQQQAAQDPAPRRPASRQQQLMQPVPSQQPPAAGAAASRQRSQQQQRLVDEPAQGAQHSSQGHDADSDDCDDNHDDDGPTAAAGKKGGALRDGKEIFKYMKQLAEDAGGLLPQEQAEAGKKRGRGRPKKDLRLVDALHQCWQGKSYYERLQEITRQEMQETECQEEAEAAPTALLPKYKPTADSTDGTETAAAADDMVADAPQEGQKGAQQSLGSKKQAAAHAGDAAAESGGAAGVGKHGGSSNTAATAGGRKRRTGRQGPSRSVSPEESNPAEAGEAEAAAVESTREPLAEAAAALGDAAGTAALGPSSKRRATLAGAAVGAAAAAPTRARRTTILSGRTSTTTAAAAIAAGKSPLPATSGRPPSSSRAGASAALAAATPAAAAPASLADRPPFSVGPSGPSAGGAAGLGSSAAAAAGGAVGCGTSKADRGAVQKLQSALDTKCEELLGVKEQLKESQELVSKLRHEQKAHPKALQQLEKQKQALEKKLDAAARRESALERENEGLQDKLARQEDERVALQDQLSKSEREVKALRLKLKQAAAKLEKAQTLGSKLQELGAGLMADTQPPAMDF